MKKILLQVGHLNIEKLTKTGLRAWRDVETLKKSTGAGGERDYFSTKVVPALKTKLEAVGFEVTVADAIYNNDIYSKTYDLYISFHYDGGGVQNRCMISSPKRGQEYLNDKAHNEADRFCTIWKDNYPKITGAVNNDGMITAGMLEYYGFDYVDVNTPAVIIEHFNQTSDLGKKLKEDPAKVIEGDYTTILKFFNMADTPTTSFFNFDVTKKIPEKAFSILGWNKLTKLNEIYLKENLALDKTGEKYEEALGKIEDLKKDLVVAESNKQTALQDLETTKNTEITKLKDKITELNKQNAKVLTIGEVLLQVWYKIKDITIEVTKK